MYCGLLSDWSAGGLPPHPGAGRGASWQVRVLHSFLRATGRQAGDHEPLPRNIQRNMCTNLRIIAIFVLLHTWMFVCTICYVYVHVHVVCVVNFTRVTDSDVVYSLFMKYIIFLHLFVTDILDLILLSIETLPLLGRWRLHCKHRCVDYDIL